MRRELIQEIQGLRKSKVITYITGDRNPAVARIAEDAVRPLYEHLLAIGNNKRIDLFLYSRGGDVSVPWRVVSMFREFCGEFSVLVPYKAQSAATLLSLGADKIVMGKKAELGPIDPTLVKMTAGESANPPQEISVEDVNSYVAFIREKANINDQSALPPNIRPEDLPAQVQQVLQQLINNAIQNIENLVQQEIIRQSPEIGINTRIYGVKW